MGFGKVEIDEIKQFRRERSAPALCRWEETQDEWRLNGKYPHQYP